MPRSFDENTFVVRHCVPGPKRSCDATYVPSGKMTRLGDPMNAFEDAGLCAITTPGTFAHGDGATVADAVALALAVVLVVDRGVHATATTSTMARMARS